MTDEHRKRIFDALVGDAIMFPPGDVIRVQIEISALGQLESLEPIIDDIIKSERGDQR